MAQYFYQERWVLGVMNKIILIQTYTKDKMV